MSASPTDRLRLMVVTDADLHHGRNLISTCEATVRGGATIVEVRDKSASARDLFDLTVRLVEALSVPVIVNDRLDVALAAHAAGCHLGMDDIPVACVRDILPPGFVLGLSVGTADEVDAMRVARAVYWGVGPCYNTTTKADAGPGIGPEGLRTINHLASGTPCVGIGGITAENAGEVIRAGAVGVAVVSAVMSAADPETATRAIRNQVNAALPSTS